jgi:hypothetical protein
MQYSQKFKVTAFSIGLIGCLGIFFACSKAPFQPTNSRDVTIKSSTKPAGPRAGKRPISKAEADADAEVEAEAAVPAPGLPGSSANVEGSSKFTPSREGLPNNTNTTVVNAEKLPVTVVPPTQNNPCTPREKPYRILILDLKSGWFAGDGDGFFADFLKIECSQKVEIIYAHVTRELIETNFKDSQAAANLLPCLGGGKVKRSFGTDKCRLGSITNVDQAWLLSGSSRDGDDLKIGGDFYKSIKERFLELKAMQPQSSFFLSAGVGNTDHSNDMARDLLPELVNRQGAFNGKIFTNNPKSPVGTLPNRGWGKHFPAGLLSPGNGVTNGTFLSTFPAFKDLTAIFDYKHQAHNNLGKCLTDPVVAVNTQSLIQDHCSQIAAAAAMIGTHKIYLEGNTARFYGSRSEEELKTGKVGPMDYFLRVVGSLM